MLSFNMSLAWLCGCFSVICQFKEEWAAATVTLVLGYIFLALDFLYPSDGGADYPRRRGI